MAPDFSLSDESTNAKGHWGRGQDPSDGNKVPLQKENEDDRRATEERFRSTFEQAAVGIAQVAPDGRYLRVNACLCDIVGYTLDELLTKKFLETVHPDDLTTNLEYQRQMLANERDRYSVETRYVRKDASIIWVNATASLVHHRNADLDYFIVVAEDIAQRKRLDEELRALTHQLESRVEEGALQLEAANKELESLSYSIAHDLRAPLRGIDGWSQALLREYGTSFDEKGTGYLKRVRAETQRMGKLIDDVLMLSTVARIAFHRTSFILNPLLDRVTTRVRRLYPDQIFDFVVQPQMTISADLHLIELVVTNLVDNACKFTRGRSPGRIEIGQSEQEGKPYWFVRDNGVGFDMKYARKLFVPFQRLHRQSEYPGTGIGLAIVHQIIVRHGGKVWVDAQKHSGATFFFTV